MSYFGNTLTRWLEAQQNLTISELAALTHQPRPDLTSIRDGEKRITFKALSKFVPAIAQHYDRATALMFHVAYLRDEIIDEWRDHIHITHTDPATLSEGESTLPDPISQIAARWQGEAQERQDFAEMWMTLDHSLFTNPPAKSE